MHYLVILIVIFQAVIANSQDLSLYKKKEFVSSNGTRLPYRILLPENYNPRKKYPLILFLHGAGERGNDNEKQLTHGAKLFLSDENRKNFPAIVLFPQCPENNYWAQATIDRTTTPFKISLDYSKPETEPLKAAIELINSLQTEKRVIKKQIYIAGLSMGGMGTFEAVYRHPKLFAAATPICGGGDLNRYDKRVSKVPFRIFHGDADAVVDVNLSRQMVEKLKSLSVEVIYKEYPGVNHNSWDNAFAEPDYISWMFTKKRY
jgi:predicted peptidase